MAPFEPSAVQLSPLIPGAFRIEDYADGAFASLAVSAPAGVLDRRYVLGQALRVLAPGGRLTALAPNDRGGMRLAAELADFGCSVDQLSRRHHRICHTIRPDAALGVELAINACGIQRPPALGLWSQPGVFSWDRPDPGSMALIGHLPSLSGSGADFGCGVGLLARTVLQSISVVRLSLIDIDRRAVDAARRNIEDERCDFAWCDLRAGFAETEVRDFVVMNPPFHDGGIEDRGLGEVFIRRAACALRKGGVCWLVANRHLPYEAHLKVMFAKVRQVAQADGYKIYEARK